MTPHNIKKALTYLQTDPLLHMGMLEVLRRGQAKICYADTDGVLLREDSGGAYMLSASSPQTAERLIIGIRDAEAFLVHQRFSVPLLQQRFHYTKIYDCLQAVYTRASAPSVLDQYDIQTLTLAHEKAVLQYYHSMDDPAYIRDRIIHQEMFGAFNNGALLGFIGVHAEGSIGLLEVLPKYKRMGVASALESFLIRLHLQKGWTPFCEVLADNTASLSLQRKLGLEISTEHLYWVS